MFVSLIAWEVLTAPGAERKRIALRLTGGFFAIVVLSVLRALGFLRISIHRGPAGYGVQHFGRRIRRSLCPISNLP